jgi:3-phosphoshikimate 1-carboxyvinyltransferase
MSGAADVKIISRFPRGVVTPPPSKSISHRAVICAALSPGGSAIENLGRSDDVDATIEGTRALGLPGMGGGATDGSICVVDCRESGSTLRFLLPVAAALGRRAVFSGRGRLMARPLDAYAEIFADAGVTFERSGGGVAISGRLRGGSFVLPGDVSSQFVSGLLLALPLLEADSEIRVTTPLESAAYVGLTLDMMRRFGVRAEASEDNAVYRVRGGQAYRAARCVVEADHSQAAFFLAAAALGSDVTVAGLSPDSRQGDRAMLDILARMGAGVEWRDGKVTARAGRLISVEIDARETPDLVPPLAVLCCFCEGGSAIVNAGRLRAKESDRLSALASELGRLGASVEEGGDFLRFSGAARLWGGDADAWGDHRIAMALAVASTRCDAPVRLSGWRSVSKSYPDFWRDFEGGDYE